MRWHGIRIEAVDPARLARWWAQVLRYRIVSENPEAVEIGDTARAEPALVFVHADPSGLPHQRLHFELACDDLDGDIERLLDMGARRGTAGHNATSVLLADPEGNEFLMLQAAVNDCAAHHR